MKLHKTLGYLCLIGFILVLSSKYPTQYLLYILGNSDNSEFTKFVSLNYLQVVTLLTISSFLFYFIRHNLLYKVHTPNKLLLVYNN